MIRVFFVESCLSCGSAQNVGFRPRHHLNCVWNEPCLHCSVDHKDSKAHITLAMSEDVVEGSLYEKLVSQENLPL